MPRGSLDRSDVHTSIARRSCCLRYESAESGLVLFVAIATDTQRRTRQRQCWSSAMQPRTIVHMHVQSARQWPFGARTPAGTARACCVPPFCSDAHSIPTPTHIDSFPSHPTQQWVPLLHAKPSKLSPPAPLRPPTPHTTPSPGRAGRAAHPIGPQHPNIPTKTPKRKSPTAKTYLHVGHAGEAPEGGGGRHGRFSSPLPSLEWTGWTGGRTDAGGINPLVG